MAVSSWFVEVTKFKDRMVELNQEITWVPEHVKDGQFGKWLENARDWSISRNRFWGSPIPVWRSDNPAYPRIDVYGSFEELERDFGRLPLNENGEPDLHRPFVDHLTRPNPDDPTGNSTMRRVEDVLDVWFDSGSMSFAQVHYPFENADWFEHHFPGDFIVEYIGQTRGWFYTLHVLATALFDRPAFSSCVSHGIVLGSDGQKMSKSLKQLPRRLRGVQPRRRRRDALVPHVERRSCAAATSSSPRTGIREGVRQVLIPLWNSWYFFSLYANAADGGQGYAARWSTASTDPLDRYLLAKLRDLVETVQDQMDAYDIPGACEAVRQFVDAMTNWYIRRSRERFWDTGAGDGEVSHAAFDTLYTTLEVLTRVAAPLLPLVTEEIWRGLTGGRSVHLEDWPTAAELPADDALVAAMDQVRAVCSTGSSLRKAEKLRVRLPLRALTVVTKDPAGLQPFAAIIADELNVKAVSVVDAADRRRGRLRHHPAARRQRPRRRTPPRQGRADRHPREQVRRLVGGGRRLGRPGRHPPGEGSTSSSRRRTPRQARAPTSRRPLPGGGGLVVLDTEVSPELELEGAARDLVRAVQQARRDAGLEVSDRISLEVSGARARRPGRASPTATSWRARPWPRSSR